MVEKKKTFKVFLAVLFILILLLIFTVFGLSNKITSVLSIVSFPIQKSFYSTFGRILISNDNLRIKELERANLELNKKILDQEKLKEDIQALRDQFEVSNPKSTNLLTAKVVGFSSFIPNVSLPESLVIDKGEDDGLRVGQAVIFKDNLVGKITKVSGNKALVYLVTHPDLSFTAKTLNSRSEGIVKGLGGGEMILDNVLLSENLTLGEILLTKGDLNIDNIGFPPNLIIGKITAINKIPSALFQTAGVKSLIDFSNLETVFVYIGL